MDGLMMDFPLTLTHLFDRAGTYFRQAGDRQAPSRQVGSPLAPTRTSTGARASSPTRSRGWG